MQSSRAWWLRLLRHTNKVRRVAKMAKAGPIIAPTITFRLCARPDVDKGIAEPVGAEDKDEEVAPLIEEAELAENEFEPEPVGRDGIGLES